MISRIISKWNDLTGTKADFFIIEIITYSWICTGLFLKVGGGKSAAKALRLEEHLASASG